MISLANLVTNFVGAGLGLPMGYQGHAPSFRNNPYSYRGLQSKCRLRPACVASVLCLMLCSPFGGRAWPEHLENASRP
ncbi:protein of unknown function [Candidatus Filomicrobium marinum]|uniref:Uncharacterized protein n=1 Tax=Candidatus Filomicrobium marinum TaxID=1608628 RepID=A0A0D6JB05_9HYPH|nr:protein of unknown function [Candidatus Filomicrobium marinum]CPR16018.1 protein of unknown function [Candidatus Filomicrobium marinum]